MLNLFQKNTETAFQYLRTTRYTVSLLYSQSLYSYDLKKMFLFKGFRICIKRVCNWSAKCTPSQKKCFTRAPLREGATAT